MHRVLPLLFPSFPGLLATQMFPSREGVPTFHVLCDAAGAFHTNLSSLAPTDVLPSSFSHLL